MASDCRKINSVKVDKEMRGIGYFLFLSSFTFVNIRPDDVNPYCNTPCGYEHTACRTKPCMLDTQRCKHPAKILPLSIREKNIIYFYHNIARSLIAKTGANNVHAVSYDPELEFAAQCWANTCTPEKETCRYVKCYT